jgi:chromosome segregation ATPase
LSLLALELAPNLRSVTLYYVKRAEVTGLTGLFKAAPEVVEDNEKLVDLFRNRAELKKEFAALRNEKYQLQDRIKQHEGATARVQQQMDHLESLLLDREWVHNVVAFYQLRRLAAHCNVKLSRFAEELKQQREQRVHSKTTDAWNEQRDTQAASIEGEIGEHRLQVQLLEDQLQAERHKLTTMNGVSKMFRGRGLETEIDLISARIDAGQAREQELLQGLDKVYNATPPDHGGLDNMTKRSVNFMILSFAQQLYLHFAEDNLAQLAKDASEKSVGAVNYGTKYECDEIIERVEKRWDSMESVTDFADVLQRRAKLIARHAVFRNDDDVIPAAGSVATVFAIGPNGVVKEKDANLLGDNYFGIFKILSR